MSDFICINDRNQLPKYIPGYDTPEKAEAASLAMSANQTVYAEADGAIGGPGSYIKTITIIPVSDTISNNIVMILDDVEMTLWGLGSFGEVPPLVTLVLGVTNTGSGNVSLALPAASVRLIVTGYFTPTV